MARAMRGERRKLMLEREKYIKDGYLSAGETAHATGISSPTLYKHSSNGDYDGFVVRVGRSWLFHPELVRKLVKKEIKPDGTPYSEKYGRYVIKKDDYCIKGVMCKYRITHSDGKRTCPSACEHVLTNAMIRQRLKNK